MRTKAAIMHALALSCGTLPTYAQDVLPFPPNRWAAPSGRPCRNPSTSGASSRATGTVRRTLPAAFTVSETFDVGMDTSSPVANDYFEKAPFEFERTLKKLHFKNLPASDPGFMPSPEDD
ncbi:MAG: hypothetical protein R3F07_06975 [Opitutaceae bacterium]